MRVLQSPWPLGIATLVLSGLEYLTAPSFDEQLASIAGSSLDPETIAAVGTIGSTATLAVSVISLGSLLWLIFWKYPSKVRWLAWCAERPGRSLLWSLVLGGSAAWSAFDAVAELGASHFLGAACNIGWTACLIALRAVVVSRLMERRHGAAAGGAG